MERNTGKAVSAAFAQLSYKEQWYLEKRNAICMTCGRVSPLSTQSTFEDLAVDFEGTTASGAERFYRRTLDKLRLKLLESGVIHTVTLKQTDMRKKNKRIAAAVYLYQADNDGEWGEIRFSFFIPHSQGVFCSTQKLWLHRFRKRSITPQNCRRCLPVSGGQRRRMGGSAV